MEFDSREDFVSAYKSANYRKIDGYKVIVDFERGKFYEKKVAHCSSGGQDDLEVAKDTWD